MLWAAAPLKCGEEVGRRLAGAFSVERRRAGAARVEALGMAALALLAMQTAVKGAAERQAPARETLNFAFGLQR